MMRHTVPRMQSLPRIVMSKICFWYWLKAVGFNEKGRSIIIKSMNIYCNPSPTVHNTIGIKYIGKYLVLYVVPEGYK